MVLLDPRLSQDKPVKMEKEIEHFVNQKPKVDRIPRYSKPTHLSVSYFANRDAMLISRDVTVKHAVEPVCFTTSSRSTQQDYGDRNTTAEEFAKRSAEVVSELGFRSVIVAASDAPIVKDVNQ